MTTHETAGHPPSGVNQDEQMARALGWLSLGIGLAAVLAPRAVAGIIGVRCTPMWLRIVGSRKLANGLGILSERGLPAWVWARFAGDVAQLALLDAARSQPGALPGRIGVAAAAVVGIGAVDVTCASNLMRSPGALHALKQMLETGEIPAK